MIVVQQFYRNCQMFRIVGDQLYPKPGFIRSAGEHVLRPLTGIDQRRGINHLRKGIITTEPPHRFTIGEVGIAR